MEHPIQPRTELSSQDQKRQRAIELAKLAEKLRFQKIALYQPNPKQQLFHELGGAKRFRLYMAGNQQGKTLAGGFETACHLTGRYPPWWKGHTFDRPIRAWVGGINGMKVRDNPQLKLFGPRSAFGTGFIPRDCIKGEPSMSKGTTGLIDQAEIRHVRGGSSFVKFMSYDMMDDAWESDTLHLIWYDEEPPETKHTAGIARLTVTMGISYLTFTPLNGMSNVVRLYYPHPSTPERAYVRAGMNDATHIPEEHREELIRQYPFHERKARAEGFPILGSGNVYDVPEEAVRIEAFKCPDHFPQLFGLDIGGGSDPTAFVRVAWDRDEDVAYLIDAYRQIDPRISTHAAALRQRGKWVPVAWPHDAHIHDRAGDGESYADIYRKHGVNMLPSHSVMESGGYQVEPGIALIHDRLSTGRLRVFEHLDQWWEEYRLYHRKDGRVVKEYDHLMDATRQAIMMLRYARVQPNPLRLQQTVGMDYDPLSGG